VATALRVLQQIRHDPRTIALVLVVPAGLLWLLSELLGELEFDRLGAAMVGMFPFISMFLVTSIAMLRERTSGTLERLMTMPLAKLDLLAGYALAFAVIAVVQAAAVSAVAIGLLDLHVAGSTALVAALAVLNALLGMALGLFLSAFAATEFQAVQFMPAFVLPQFLLCGLLVPRDTMDTALRWVSDVLPLSYAVDAMRSLTTTEEVDPGAWGDLSVVVLAILLALGLGAATLRRRTP
jgi:ABC-2 type transport system permease protein